VRDFAGLKALARRQGGADAATNRGACRLCGGLGHLTKQCRNFLDSGTAGAAAGGAAGAAGAAAGGDGDNRQLLTADDDEALLLGSDSDARSSDLGSDSDSGSSGDERVSASGWGRCTLCCFEEQSSWAHARVAACWCTCGHLVWCGGDGDNRQLLAADDDEASLLGSDSDARSSDLGSDSDSGSSGDKRVSASGWGRWCCIEEQNSWAQARAGVCQCVPVGFWPGAGCYVGGWVGWLEAWVSSLATQIHAAGGCTCGSRQVPKCTQVCELCMAQKQRYSVQHADAPATCMVLSGVAISCSVLSER
jgi:hypothetical protein